ncbi:SPARC-like protein 1 [Cyprinus carpio]|uniref:SPARC-like protein 1 n=1 Tax=Cyprinus carpio TaxID=7962 RepID=A0A9Q9VWG3_CYPCA|nr:SPARC-like protein 1 [Cyprinus carpio]
MKKDLFLFCFLVSALAASVQSNPHGKKQHVRHNTTPKEQPGSVKRHDSNDGVLPTFLPFESSTQDPEDEDKREENESRVEMKQAEAEELEVSEEGEKNTPLLLSEEALSQLLQVPEEEDDDSSKKDKEMKEMEEEGKKDGESTMKNEDGTEKRNGEKDVEDANETDSSTESEIPIDLDYATDRDASQPLPTKLEEVKASTINAKEKETEETAEDVIPTVTVDYDSQQSNTDSEDIAEEQDVPAEQTQDEPLQDSENDNEQEKSDQQDKKNSSESEDAILSSGKKTKKEKKKQKNEGNSHGKSKHKRLRNNQHLEKMQSDQAEHNHRKDPEKLEEPTENTEPKTKKKNGKWSRLVGMNPIQIRAAMELYPDIRPTHRPSGQGLSDDPCENFRCKRGKTCKMNDENKPVCVCQEPSECPLSVNDFEHVCGTDNKTYDTSCQLFATKCGLEGTKIGHRLHLDYTGSCKFIPPCPESELVQFPLRMRDWLKNVLLQLYEHESMSPGFLTAKQSIRVQKIYESERRLHADDHSVEILQQDFEKNYNMYIYPVHWQFAQMDQHPSDKFLSHSELAPLRVPLVPMEHCTSVFFQKCDADKDKLVSFKEWCSCFGIKEDDMDANLLF